MAITGDEYKRVLREINELQAMIPNGLSSVEKPDWESIWAQIRVVGPISSSYGPVMSFYFKRKGHIMMPG